MRKLFENEESLLIVTEAGYHKPLPLIKLSDREELSLALQHYYTMIRGKLELDKFVEGLNTYDILSMIRKYPKLMQPLLVCKGVKITKGMQQYVYIGNVQIKLVIKGYFLYNMQSI